MDVLSSKNIVGILIKEEPINGGTNFDWLSIYRFVKEIKEKDSKK